MLSKKLFSELVANTCSGAANCMFVEISPLLASKILLLNTNNRSLSERLVVKYAQEILNDEWIPCSSGIGISETGILQDGQHRLAAIVQAGKSAKMLVAYDLPELAQQKIDRNRSRSVYDGFTLSGIVDKGIFGKKCVQIAMVLCRSNNKEFHSKIPPDSDVKNYIKENEKLIKVIVSKAQTNRGRLSAPAFLAGVYRYAEIDLQKALEFLNQVQTGEMISNDSPSSRLRKALLYEPGHNYFFTASRGCAGQQVTVYQTTLYAAKMHYEGQSITKLNQAKSIR